MLLRRSVCEVQPPVDRSSRVWRVWRNVRRFEFIILADSILAAVASSGVMPKLSTYASCVF